MPVTNYLAGAFLATFALVVDRNTVEVFPTVFDPSPVEAPDDQRRRRAPREEEQDDEEFEEAAPLMPASVNKWTRLYIKTGQASGKIVLAVQKLHPKRKGDTTWTAVDNERKVTTVNLNDKRRVSAKRAAGVEYDDFVPLSRPEKDDANEASKDLVLRASRSAPENCPSEWPD